MALGVLLAAAPTAAKPLVDRRLERPASQKGQHGTTSFVERAVTLSGSGSAAFDFFVDSEEGKDFLDVLVDGQVRFRASGSHRGGKGSVPLTAGTHLLGLAYTKDAAGSAGLDTAWIDRITVLQGNRVLESHLFREKALGAASGWQGGGHAGGLVVSPATRRRSLRRPIDGAFTGYQPGPVRSSLQRSLVWPADSQQNDLVLTFWVDSEEGADFLRVYVDGQERFAVSGRDKSGRKRISVGSAGSHTIEIVYDKDTSVDAGTDDARILELQAASELGIVEFGGFESGELGALPDGWSTGPHGTGGLAWTIGHDIPPRVYAERVAPSAVPVVNGEIQDEYDRQSVVRLPHLADQRARFGKLWLETTTSGTLYFALRAPKGGDGPASFELALDAANLATVSGTSCPGNGSAPSPLARRFTLTFPAGLGAPGSIAQAQGACGSPDVWIVPSPGDEWTVTAAAGLPEEDPGFVHLEMSVVLPEPLRSEDLGLALRWERGGVDLALPRSEAAPPEFDDAATWEKIRYDFIEELVGIPLLVIDGKPIPGGD